METEIPPPETLPSLNPPEHDSLATAPLLTRRQFLARNLGLFCVAAAGQAIGRPHLPEITRYRLKMPGLRQPTRLLQLTDFHRSWCVSEWYLAECVRMANSLRPDVIALTGDFVTRSSHYAISCAEILKDLNAPLGLYGTLGNHDHRCDNYTGAPAVTEIMATAGVQMLTNRNKRLENGLWLAGIDDQWIGAPDPAKAFTGIAPADPTICLTHNPEQFRFMPPEYRYTMLAGHTHGGQINIPYFSKRIIGSHIRYKQGWFTEPKNGNRLYVSRGLGVVTIPFRFRASPEMTLFYLEPG